jgi:hypothetical protein
LRRLILAALLMTGACSGDADVPQDAPSQDAAPSTTAPAADSSAPNYTPPKLTPEAEKGEKGARNVLLSWAHAMEDRAFASAYALYRKGGPASGQSAADYATSFAGYRTITAAIGDGMVDGAAGSLYYQVPVTLTGEAQDGSPYRRSGTITLRRVNDVPGAEDWQLAWHIDTIEWKETE